MSTCDRAATILERAGRKCSCYCPSLATTILPSVSTSLTILGFDYMKPHIKGIINICPFGTALFQLPLYLLGSSTLEHVWEFPSFFKDEYHFIVCIYHILLRNPPILGGCLCCFQLLAIVYNAIKWMYRYIWVSVFTSFGYIP